LCIGKGLILHAYPKKYETQNDILHKPGLKIDRIIDVEKKWRENDQPYFEAYSMPKEWLLNKFTNIT
jgi:hypothetical protein